MKRQHSAASGIVNQLSKRFSSASGPGCVASDCQEETSDDKGHTKIRLWHPKLAPATGGRRWAPAQAA